MTNPDPIHGRTEFGEPAPAECETTYWRQPPDTGHRFLRPSAAPQRSAKPASGDRPS